MAIATVVDHYRLERTMLRHPDGQTLAALSGETGMPKPTLLNHLRTMAEYGRAEQDDSGAWRPSRRWLAMIVTGYATGD